jgi:hypothetical protein
MNAVYNLTTTLCPTIILATELRGYQSVVDGAIASILSPMVCGAVFHPTGSSQTNVICKHLTQKILENVWQVELYTPWATALCGKHLSI